MGSGAGEASRDEAVPEAETVGRFKVLSLGRAAVLKGASLPLRCKCASNLLISDSSLEISSFSSRARSEIGSCFFRNHAMKQSQRRRRISNKATAINASTDAIGQVKARPSRQS